MAKAIAKKRQQNKVNLESLSERDRDILTLETKEAMKKYNLGKQGVYDRKFALNKKIRAAGLSAEDLLNNEGTKVAEPAKKAAVKKAAVKKAAAKKVRQVKAKATKQAENKPDEPQQQPITDVVKYEKPIPVIMKPIEINFESFSIKLNGVPKKIAVNPETNAIEIDL